MKGFEEEEKKKEEENKNQNRLRSASEQIINIHLDLKGTGKGWKKCIVSKLDRLQIIIYWRINPSRTQE